MLRFNNYVIDQLLIPSTVLFFFVGGIAAVIIAVGLIMNSATVFRLFGIMNASVSTRVMTKPMAIPRDSSGVVWAYRWPIATFFTIGAVFSLYGLIAQIDSAAAVAALKLNYPPAAVLLLVESARRALIVGCVVALAVGILLAFFPDAMRSINTRTSRWVSTRRIAPNADRMEMVLDKWVAAFPRTAGGVILFPALGMVLYFGALLLQ